MAAMTYRGIVRDNRIVLENATTLPEGSKVVVSILESKPDLARRKVAGAKLRELGKRFEGRKINLSKCVVEAREELERRV